MSRQRAVDPIVLLQVAAAALIGGALAVAALARLRDIDLVLVGVFVLTTVAVSVLAGAVLLPGTDRVVQSPRAEHRPPGSEWPAASQPGLQEPEPGWSWTNARRRYGAGENGALSAAAPAAPAPSPAPAAPASRWRSTPGPAPVSAAIPVQGGAWWRSASAGARTRPPQAVAPTQDPPGTAPAGLSDYAGATRVVQCPRCGDFRVDVGQREPGFAFTCKRCDHHWRWEPGSAWPTTVVRPRLGRRPGPSGGTEPI